MPQQGIPFPSSLAPFLTGFLWVAVILEVHLATGTTDPSDVQALQGLYSSLNSPSQLTNWKSSGGDPCTESWKGVTCVGSSVVSIQLSGLSLSGSMGYSSDNLKSLGVLDLSNNNMTGQIPYQLPPNLTSLNLGGNNFTGNLPYSMSTMYSLNYLNVTHNSLSQPLQDFFSNLGNLSTMDLSFNSFSGNLPASFSSITNISSLYMQNNQFTGSLNVLVGLPLTTLNVADNQFSGWIPKELSSVQTFIYNGNYFSNGPAPPPPPYTPPPPAKARSNRTHSGSDANPPGSSGGQRSSSGQGLTTAAVIGIVAGSVLLLAILLVGICLWSRKTKKQVNGGRTAAGGSHSSSKRSVSSDIQEQSSKSIAAVVDLKPPPFDKVVVEVVPVKNGSVKGVKLPVTATSYTVATLQTATNSFSQDNLIGEGSLGRVYRAEFPNGKVMAIKKIDNAALSLQEEDNFLEAVANMSRLRHPNIVSLAGYCTEHGQRLLVYEYIGNGNLHDLLHFAEDGGRTLGWNARVRVALGIARALEYLHEVCLPLVVHRNLKSANILLDDELTPHLSDCGLAPLIPNTERQVAAQMVGSFGYSAPEFAFSGVYTVKSDVYSFGVVMLEILTGRKPLDSSRARSEQSLVRWATPQLHDIDALSKMVDPSLNGMYPAKSLSRFADIIALCVQPEPEFRPPMSEVIQQLVRLVQRASVVKRLSSDESSFAYRTPDYEGIDAPF
ncbi:hypothetical protein MLD38_010551 [Melastoma candidum]|uniref:Uncharacterized protein n=1 Tax=Melastoma candidum TaxID=119954 RepID=A0ACB9R0S8_9MYRT|nr:hypothetical protein MLD38_010551 [Melastoma candidum]